MASNTLSGAGNSPSNTKNQLLHIGSGTLGAGAVVRLGDGTATPLTISSAGMALAGDFTCDALVINGVEMRAMTTRRLTADVVATDTTLVPLSDLNFVPVIGATYALELVLIAVSAATAGALQVAHTSGVGSLTLAPPGGAGIANAGETYSPSTSPVAGTWLLLLKGFFNPSSAEALGFSIKSDDTNDVTVKANSYLSITRI